MTLLHSRVLNKNIKFCRKCSYAQKDILPYYNFSAACYKKLFILQYGEEVICEQCNKLNKYSYCHSRRTFACICGKQLSPTARTIFSNSSLPIEKYLEIFQLFQQNKNMKEIQRNSLVSYRTILRIKKSLEEERNVKIFLALIPNYNDSNSLVI